MDVHNPYMDLPRGPEIPDRARTTTQVSAEVEIVHRHAKFKVVIDDLTVKR